MPATLEAFSKATRDTLAGSTIPRSSMSPYSPVEASYPKLADGFRETSANTTGPSWPEFSAMIRRGSTSADFKIWSAIASSASSFRLSRAGRARTYATPPPGTIPSSRAARVAARASSALCFRSLSCGSVGAPTLMMATPPESFAILSCSFSLSYSEVVSSSWT